MHMFGNLRQTTRRLLKDTLREKVVDIKRRRGVFTWDSLFGAAQEELTWPTDEAGTQDESVKIEIHPSSERFKANELVSPS